jgi:hypothetical protein
VAERVRRGRLAAVAIVALLVLAGWATSADAGGPAAAATADEAAALAREAATSDEALDELRAIDEIDGTPVDLAAATVAIEADPARADRLVALADQLAATPSTGGGDIDADAARADARSVLDGDEYRADEPPRPFKGVLEWLGDRLAPVGRALDRVFGPIFDAIGDVPGGPYLAVAVLAAGLTWWIARLAARRSRARIAAGQGGARLLVDLDADPVALDRAAADAEAAGDLGAAVRLRYEAGLIRLVRADRLVLHADTTARRAADQVGGAVLAGLTSSFEEIVYGGRTATSADVAAAREGWPEVLEARPVR